MKYRETPLRFEQQRKNRTYDTCISTGNKTEGTTHLVFLGTINQVKDF